MILGALLLTLIGSADLLRSTHPARGGGARSRWLIIVVWAAVVTLAVFGLGIALWWVAIAVALAVLWLITTSPMLDVRTAAGNGPAVGLLLALLAFLAWDRTALSLHGFIVEWHSDAPIGVVQGVPLPTVLVGIGVVLFIIESANIIVRASLRPSQVEAQVASVADSPARRWWMRPEQPIAVVADLKGGRMIGPLERLLIIALTLAGFAPIVAGLLAAKGIVRFPEISTDGASGSKAEYFLVGSLVSWSVAFAGTALVWVSAQS
ncbi:hypothetical protein B0I08_103188 [Glaciihabitans tibetensis]|uniref:Uncharacterized protein n=1 Tax=Glaciihabitans tibetensis TaxID=1266600 RepID=A0A2T0VFP4_9MICO|nr:hypothetical protein [Glaciihabitans tibetensis]PRY68982.1 hypothetical protein B0I08_103188 [Glaciihabitans tibetensis]